MHPSVYSEVLPDARNRHDDQFASDAPNQLRVCFLSTVVKIADDTSPALPHETNALVLTQGCSQYVLETARWGKRSDPRSQLPNDVRGYQTDVGWRYGIVCHNTTKCCI